jgi:hypothetical protein
MSHTVASQFVRHDLARFIPVTFEQSLEEALGGLAIPARLREYINHFAILIDGTPKIVLLTLDFHKHLVEEKRIALLLVCAP